MFIQLWVFLNNGRLELWEGDEERVPMRADHSREIRPAFAVGSDAARKLCDSVIRISRRWRDPLKVRLMAHPMLKKDCPHGYKDPNPAQKKEMTKILWNENREQMERSARLG